MDGHEWREESLKNLRPKIKTFVGFIAPIYKRLEWGWREKKHYRIPDEKMLEKKLRGDISYLLRHENIVATGSGGLRVSFNKQDGIAEMEFIISMITGPSD